ncbi:MAG: hypothetical protein K2O11_11650 [Oscillospiraceae bacterium]|nr:hypothetical protein [Oscillospiraceae bacterium]
MKKRFGPFVICTVLCVALLGSCRKNRADIPVFSAWSDDTVFTPIEELSWPEACLDENWPTGGFEKSVAELAFDELDLKKTFSMGLPIVYEDEKILIFWGQQGIFGLELPCPGESCKIVFSLSFSKLFGEEGIVQGSDINTVAVRRDGTRMVVGNWKQTGAPEKDWCLVDLPSLTYKKTAVYAQMRSYTEPMDSTFWTDEIFDQASAVGWIDSQGCLGQAIYVQSDNYEAIPYKVVPIFKNYMEFTPFP